MSVKDRIKELCKNNKISVNKLEKELGFATGYISKLDKSTPNTKKIQTIADYFNVSLDYLLTGVMPEVKDIQNGLILSEIALNDNLMSSIEKLLKLKSSDKDLVIDLINSLYEKVGV